MEIFCNILQQGLPKEFNFEHPHGGYFIWIRGPPNKFNTEEFFRQLSEVQILCGLKASSAKDEKWKSAFRISIAFYDQKTLSKAAKLLCASITNYLQK